MPINPFACFEAFASLKPILKKDARGRDVPSAEVTWSYPHAPNDFLPTFTGCDKMCFPTFGTTSGVTQMSGDGTFIFVLTREWESTSRDLIGANNAAIGSSGGSGGPSGASSSSGSGGTSGHGGHQEVIKQLYGHCVATVNGEAFVFLSRYPWVGFFRTLLDYYKGNGPLSGQALLKDLYAVPTPSEAGASFGIRFGGSVLRRPMDLPHMSGVDTDPLMLLSVFTDKQLFQIVSAMLLVETIIICGPDFGIVSKIIIALRALIAPVDPQCWVYASVLPKVMIDYIASPVPGIFGITDDCLPSANEACRTLSAAVFVQLSSSNVSSSTNNSNEPMTPASPKKRPKKPVGGKYYPDEDNPPFDGSVWCSSVHFLGTEPAPLPRTASIFSSSIRRGLAALRSAKKDARRSEDLLMLFVRYFAVHLGHVGSPDFTEATAIERHRSIHKRRAELKDEVKFFERFYQTQTCVELAQELKRKIQDSSRWTADPFSNMVVQLNPHWYGSELAKYRKEELPPVAPKKSSWNIFMETTDGYSGEEGAGGGRKSASLFCCCYPEDGVHSDDEQGSSRVASTNNTSSARSGLYATPNGHTTLATPTLSKETVSREDVELSALSALPIPNSARETEKEKEMDRRERLRESDM